MPHGTAFDAFSIPIILPGFVPWRTIRPRLHKSKRSHHKKHGERRKERAPKETLRSSLLFPARPRAEHGFGERSWRRYFSPAPSLISQPPARRLTIPGSSKPMSPKPRSRSWKTCFRFVRSPPDGERCGRRLPGGERRLFIAADGEICTGSNLAKHFFVPAEMKRRRARHPILDDALPRYSSERPRPRNRARFPLSPRSA